ncbi:hypothetical protein ANCCAN_29172 [Ancylostoma caninum]|uniref:Uncharacterized protein n=1 Tax=Ancylostoma caninum TaxID=29170 RepID=A0A368F0D9_ANCCA|nr:hypothetical protein ANCCAN_29172 [Ancylostoma caninum]
MLRWGAASIRCAVRLPLLRSASLAVRPAVRISRVSPSSAFRVTETRLFSSSSSGDGENPASSEDDASLETAIVEGSDIALFKTTVNNRSEIKHVSYANSRAKF